MKRGIDMFNSSNGFTMPVVPAGYSCGNNGGMFGNDSDLLALIILFALFGGNGFGFGGFGGNGGYYSEVQRGFDQNAVINKLDGLTYGLSDSTYALTGALNSGFNSVQQTLCQGFNGVSREIADCCCATQGAIKDTRYDLATQACDTRNLIQSTTRDIIDSQNASTRAILDFLTTDKIASLQAENQNLKLAASQSNQNAVLMAAMDANKAEILRRTGAECPTAAYIVQPPQPVTFPTNCYGQFSGYGSCGCGCA